MAEHVEAYGDVADAGGCESGSELEHGQIFAPR
jgi:hypothetical protein